MVYQSDYRENTLIALETATQITQQGADNVGQFVVPQNVSKITEIIISAVPAYTIDAIVGFTSVIKLSGDIKLSHGYFMGPAGVSGGAGATTPGGKFETPMRYPTNIPVTPGGRIKCEGFLCGEVITALHLLVDLVYDGVPGPITDMDVRSIDLTAANALVTMTERADATVEGDFATAGRTIKEVYVVAGAKITAGNAAVGFAFHVTGPGLMLTEQKFIGPGIGINDDTAISLGGHLVNPFRYICGSGIPTKVGNKVRVQAQMIEGDVGTAFSMIGFAY